MRRPRFKNWARSELLRTSGLRAFNLRKLAALVQSADTKLSPELLFLYAHEAKCTDRLRSFLYEPNLIERFDSIEHQLWNRSIERLALRGTPMMSLPEQYREVLAAYERAYHAPEMIVSQKKALQESSHLKMLKSGLSPADIAAILDMNASNLHAYLVRGETQRFSLEKARVIEAFLENHLLSL